MPNNHPTPNNGGTDVEPEVPVTIEPSRVRPDDEGRIQYEDEVSGDVANRPSNPNQLPPPEEPGRSGRKLENPTLPVDE